MEKINWFKQEKKEFFKGVPKKDGSGGGMRLNKGRGGCPPEKQEKFGKLGVGVHLAKELID